MEVKLLGVGCANCKRLEALAREVLAELGVSAEVEKVTDYQDIMSYGIMAMPGLVVDGEVKSSGRMPSKAEIAGWITDAVARGN